MPSDDLVKTGAYGAELVGAGKMTGSVGNLAGRWVLNLAGRDRTLRVRAEDATQLGVALADKLADLLAEQFAVVGTAGELQVVVSGVSDLGQYAQLLRYLGSLAFIDDTLVRSIEQGQLTLALQTQASQDKLLELLAVDGLLVPEDPVAARLGPGDVSPVTTPGDSVDPLAGGQLSVTPSLDMRWLGTPNS